MPDSYNCPAASNATRTDLSSRSPTSASAPPTAATRDEELGEARDLLREFIAATMREAGISQAGSLATSMSRRARSGGC